MAIGILEPRALSASAPPSPRKLSDITASIRAHMLKRHPWVARHLTTILQRHFERLHQTPQGHPGQPFDQTQLARMFHHHEMRDAFFCEVRTLAYLVSYEHKCEEERDVQRITAALGSLLNEGASLQLNGYPPPWDAE